MRSLVKNKKKPSKKKPKVLSFKKRQDMFVKEVNKIGDKLGVAIIARLDVKSDGVLPKLFLADTFEKSE